MKGHPCWCDPSACTIADPPQLYRAVRRHASKEITAGTRTSPIRLRLVQEAGRPPQVIVSMTWHHSTVALDVAAFQILHEATAAFLDLLAEPESDE